MLLPLPQQRQDLSRQMTMLYLPLPVTMACMMATGVRGQQQRRLEQPWGVGTLQYPAQQLLALQLLLLLLLLLVVVVVVLLVMAATAM